MMYDAMSEQFLGKVELSGTTTFRASDALASRVGAWIGCWWRLLSRLTYQRIRAEAGMPSPAIRLSTLHPIFASVF